tara:strand:- start:164 stop:727 length:564 start_codon:yes stop_codon:yes gene_type:complete
MILDFTYIATFISLIYGLALAHGLSCIAELLQNYKKIKNYWVWWIWAAFLLLLSNGFWVSIYNIWHELEQWKMAYVVFITFEGCLFYLCYYIFFNHINEIEKKDLEYDYYKNKRFFFLILSISIFCMLNLSEVIINEYTFIEKLKSQPPIVALTLIPLAFSENKKLHASIGLFNLSIFLIDIIFELV